MIRDSSTAGLRLTRSLGSVALSSCAVLGLAGIMVLAAPKAGPSSAQAQFGIRVPLGFGTAEKVRWRHRHRYRYSLDNEDTPDPETRSSQDGIRTPLPPPDSGRPASSSAPPDSSRRRHPRGPDLEPAK